MARGQRKSIEEKIAEKEELIGALKIRLKSEQAELDALYKEKKEKALDSLNQMIDSSGLELSEVSEALQQYIESRVQQPA
ncbi:MAG: hypothetical protein IJ409_06695 [Lachnospiraceae bacterium]|nr:hypothetical protein [Lachnospiraceae bacterium]